jgi:hypothetical protein
MMVDRGEWRPFDGDYDKRFYDIQLRDGRVFECCWPNANNFHAQNGAYVRGGYVTHVRPAPPPGWTGEVAN